MAARMSQGFDWTARNCGFFAADALEAQTGWDMFACFRGRCSSPASAIRLLRREGAQSVADFIRRRTSLTWSPAATAKLGDLLLLPDPPLDVLLVADGRGGAWGQDADRIVFLAAPERAIALRVA